MRLSQNLASLNIYMENSKVLKNQSKALDRISSGLKIQSSKDDPNAIGKSEKLRMQIRGLQMARNNAQDGVSMLQTAEGSMDEITSSIQRIKELTVQASNDTYSASDKANIQVEITGLSQVIDKIVGGSSFNGINLLGDTTGKKITMAIGANVGDVINIDTYNLTSANLGINSIDVTIPNSSTTTNTIINAALDSVISARSKYGSQENALESYMLNSNEMADRIQSADSQLRDADIAQEMIEFSKNNVLAEAGNAMLAQSNKLPQDILRILQSVK